MCDGYVAMRTLKGENSRRRHWTILRWLLVITALVTSVRVTVPDYPWGTPLWLALVGMARTEPYNGWIHEIFYIWTFFLVAAWLTYTFEERSEKRFRARGR